VVYDDSAFGSTC